jgi:hypothetical protein
VWRFECLYTNFRRVKRGNYVVSAFSTKVLWGIP